MGVGAGAAAAPAAAPARGQASPAADAACERGEGRRVDPGYGFALGEGPVYAIGFGPDGVVNYDPTFAEGGWYYVKVLWLADLDYDGAVRVRGRQLDGPDEIGFGDGADPEAELRLPAGAAPGGRREWPTSVRVRAAGCYALEVETEDATAEIVFLAVGALPADLVALPDPAAGSPPLPRDLIVSTAFEPEPGRVRVALAGADRLVLRLDVGPTGAPPPASLSDDAEALDTAAGTVRWTPHPDHGWPAAAAWDDGRHAYRLTILDAAPDAWATADLARLAEAFAETG